MGTKKEAVVGMVRRFLARQGGASKARRPADKEKVGVNGAGDYSQVPAERRGDALDALRMLRQRDQ
ncbi:MAG: hypothetical protein WC686_03585 [Candidatus Shapirobacteria bacterium]|jgi:hypothetical protein